MNTKSFANRKNIKVYNYVVAEYPEKRISRAVIIDGKNISVDDSQPITLARCVALHKELCDLTETKLGFIKIETSVFDMTNVNADGGGAVTLLDKVYQYEPRNNSLTIWEDGYPVYANDNGVICKDKEALVDSL